MSTPNIHQTPNPREVVTSKALCVWLAALAVYIVAIAGRTSFGVAGVEAIARFGVSSAAIAVFTSIQVGTYALAQIPAGVAIDKFGARAMLITGAVVMGSGQIILGFTDIYQVAIAARVLIGLGDATAFLSVMRILPFWFPARRTPLLTQITGMTGQIGQFISAVPFMWLLHVKGWQVAFVTLGALGILIAIVTSLAVLDAPPSPREVRASTKPKPATLTLGARLSSIIASPTVWNAFFIHYCGMISVIMFPMMWGVPLMTQAMGLSEPQAGLVLILGSAFLVLTSPFYGRVSLRFSGRRDMVTLVLSGCQLLGWVVFFSSGLPRGLTAMLFMIFLVSATQPISNLGFDMIRERMPHEVVATATGLSNMGGFAAGMMGTQLMGIVLADSFLWHDFQRAALACTAVWAAGFIGLIVTHFLKKKESNPA